LIFDFRFTILDWLPRPIVDPGVENEKLPLQKSGRAARVI